MGCASSKVDHEEKVARCKARKRFMKHAVAARHQFSASHAAYLQALKNVGAAFRQFGETELRDSLTLAVASSSPPSTPEATPPPRKLFLPPPSPPSSVKAFFFRKTNGSNISSPPPEHDHDMDDSASISPISSPKKSSNGKKDDPPIPSDNAPPPPPPKSSPWEFLDPFRTTANVDEQTSSRGSAMKLWRKNSSRSSQLGQDDEKMDERKRDDEDECMSLAVIPQRSESRRYKELVEVLGELDDIFLKAYECGKEASVLLESRKVHYHSNFVESKGFDSHSNKVLNALSWSHWPSLKSPHSRSTRSNSNSISNSNSNYSYSESVTSGSSDCGGHGSHAATLDRLFVWERKLYEEMRAAEAGRLEYEKKCNLLRHQDSKGDYNESIDKTRTAIKMIQTRISVALEGIDTASAAILRIRDQDLYPQLLDVQEGLTRMWVELSELHERQQEIVMRMRPLDSLLGSVEATSNIHRLAALQLEDALENWHSSLNKMMTSQRDYMRNLSGWVRLSVMPFENGSAAAAAAAREISSPTHLSLPPVHDICGEWHQVLDRLPDKVALEAIKSFVAVIHTIVNLHNEEIRHRKKVESLTKELEKKMNVIRNYESRHADEFIQPRLTRYEDDIVTEILPPKSPLADKRVAVDTLRRKLIDEKEKTRKAINDTRAVTATSLQTGLPSIFQSIAGFSRVCSQAYQGLYCNAHSNNNRIGYGDYE